MRKDSNTILYYPSINIKDGKWLRNAVLYWDKVASIVPSADYQSEDTFNIDYLQRVGIYEPIYPTDLESDTRLLDEFCSQVKTQLTLGERRWHRSRTVEVHVNKAMYTDRQINTMKTPKKILDFLLDEGIARRINGEWICMTERDSFIYMSLLAKFLAQKHYGMQIGTDERASFLSPFLLDGAASQYVDKQIFINVEINKILPCPVMKGVSLDDLVDFKKGHKKELLHFRRRISQYQQHLNLCHNRNDILEMTNDFREAIEEDMNEIEEYMCSRWKSVVRGTVTALLPLSIEFFEMRGFLPEHTSLALGAVAGINTAFRYAKKDFTVNNNNAFLFSAMREGILTRNKLR